MIDELIGCSLLLIIFSVCIALQQHKLEKVVIIWKMQMKTNKKATTKQKDAVIPLCSSSLTV